MTATSARHLATVTLEPTADPARWAAAALASGQPVHPFADHGWLHVAAGLTGTVFTPLVVRSDGADVGVVPWLARRRGPVTTVNALPFPYAGPLVPPALLPATLAELRRRARRERVVREEFGLAPTTAADEADLRSAGHTVRVDETYLIDTGQGPDALAAGLSHAARKSLRKAERDGVRILASGHDGSTLGRVVESAYGARGVDSGYATGFAPARAALEATGLAVHWTVAVEQDGAEMGSLLTVSTPDTAFLWLGGVLPEFRTSRANVLLYWEAIQWAADRGVRTVDLVGVPDPGIGRFKSQFGGTLHGYPRLQRTAPALARAEALVHRFTGALAARRRPATD
jgi:hypothetical protein